MKEIKFNPILEEYLDSLNIKEEVVEYIKQSREANPKKWDKYDQIDALNLAFDWGKSKRGFEYFEDVFSKFDTFKYKKQFASLKLDENIADLVALLHPNLAKFLITENCIVQYTQNCVNFILQHNDDLEKSLTIEEHLKSVRDILNAFWCSQTPEGVEFWKAKNEAFMVFKP